jgi:hypothetical protein
LALVVVVVLALVIVVILGSLVNGIFALGQNFTSIKVACYFPNRMLIGGCLLYRNGGGIRHWSSERQGAKIVSIMCFDTPYGLILHTKGR